MTGLTEHLPRGFFDALPIVHDSTMDRELRYFIGQRMGDSRRGPPRSVMVLPMPTTLHGFFANGCVHESAASLVSLHVTKRGALRAKIAYQFKQWVDAREDPSLNGSLHMSRDVLRWNRDFRHRREDAAYFVRPVEILP